MKFGIRIPSITKRIAARTSWKRYVRHSSTERSRMSNEPQKSCLQSNLQPNYCRWPADAVGLGRQAVVRFGYTPRHVSGCVVRLLKKDSTTCLGPIQAFFGYRAAGYWQADQAPERALQTQNWCIPARPTRLPGAPGPYRYGRFGAGTRHTTF